MVIAAVDTDARIYTGLITSVDEIMFSLSLVCYSVGVSVCRQEYAKTTERIFTNSAEGWEGFWG